jgi:small-conductance mechanosensitive channel
MGLDKWFSEETWTDIGIVCLRILLIVFLSFIVVKIGQAIIRRIFKVKLKSPIRHSERREKTLLKLLENTLSYVVYFAAILAVLSEFKIDVKGLLAGAGVLGLAVGFGAQSLVKDIITGFFIIFEDQFSVGDYVKIGTAEGEVEEIGLRTTKIKSFTGEVSILPNGSILQVINYSVENSLAIVDLTVPYEHDLHTVEHEITNYLNALPSEYDDLLGTPVIAGAQNFTATEAILRITAKTIPMRHYEMAQVISIGLKKHLALKGIELPYPVLITKR